MLILLITKSFHPITGLYMENMKKTKTCFSVIKGAEVFCVKWPEQIILKSP